MESTHQNSSPEQLNTPLDLKADFLQKLKDGNTDYCLEVLSDGKLLLVEADKLEEQQAIIDQLISDNGKYQEAVFQIKTERDSLMQAIRKMYFCFKFVFEAFDEPPQEFRLVGLLKNLLKAFGFKNMTNEMLNISCSIMMKAGKNHAQIVANAANLPKDLEPSLEILRKYKIIPEFKSEAIKIAEKNEQ